VASEEARRFWAVMRAQPKDANPTVEQRRQGDEYAEVLSSEPVGVAFAPAPAVNGLWAEPPSARPGAAILYFYGGGYVLGAPISRRKTAGHLALAAQARALIPTYRLAPEHPFPAAIEDAVAAYQWLLAEGADPARVVLAGDSAGGGLALATALALRRVPELNATWQGDEAVQSERVNVGVAISLRGGGLIAPAIHNVAELPLGELMRSLADLVKRARAGSLRSSEMSDPTVTVSNLGDNGVEAAFPIIYPPQVAIVAFGRVAPRPWVEGDALRVMPTVVASLSADHRVSDGHRGALFLDALAKRLQEPEKL